MKILVTSDTHGEINSVCEFIENNHLELMIHAGDFTKDAYNISKVTGINYITVKGNNDYSDHTNPYEQIIKVEDKNILLVHGHREDVYFTNKILIQKALDYCCNIVIFGHTHTYSNEYIKDLDLYLLNPGSPSLARDNNFGFILIDTEKNFEIKRIDLDKENLWQD